MLQNHDQTHAATTAKTGGKTVSADRVLSARLRELQIDSSGLPPHVLAHLRGVMEVEASAIQQVLATEVAALQRKAEERIRTSAARLITFKTVGKAFGAAASIKADKAKPSASPTATGGAAK